MTHLQRQPFFSKLLRAYSTDLTSRPCKILCKSAFQTVFETASTAASTRWPRQDDCIGRFLNSEGDRLSPIWRPSVFVCCTGDHPVVYTRTTWCNQKWDTDSILLTHSDSKVQNNASTFQVIAYNWRSLVNQGCKLSFYYFTSEMKKRPFVFCEQHTLLFQLGLVNYLLNRTRVFGLLIRAGIVKYPTITCFVDDILDVQNKHQHVAFKQLLLLPKSNLWG